MEPMHVRFAALDDAPAICTIYNQASTIAWPPWRPSCAMPRSGVAG